MKPRWGRKSLPVDSLRDSLVSCASKLAQQLIRWGKHDNRAAKLLLIEAVTDWQLVQKKRGNMSFDQYQQRMVEMESSVKYGFSALTKEGYYVREAEVRLLTLAYKGEICVALDLIHAIPSKEFRGWVLGVFAVVLFTITYFAMGG